MMIDLLFVVGTLLVTAIIAAVQLHNESPEGIGFDHQTATQR
jgi:hypothetical protein